MYELKNANKQITPTLYSVLRTVHTVSSLVFTLVPWEKVHSYLWNLKKMLGLEFARHQTPIILLFFLSNAQKTTCVTRKSEEVANFPGHGLAPWSSSLLRES